MSALWATEELATVELGDARLEARAVLLLATLGNCPALSIPAACGGRAELAAAYRFFDNDRVSFDAVLQPHHDRALQRVAAQPTVLLVQDTSELDLTRPAQEVVGAGDLDGSRRGVLLHVLHAFTPDGTPLGSVAAEVLNRPDGVSHAPPAQKRRDRLLAPIEDKESRRWLDGLRQARAVAQQCPQTQCVCVADSEADVYEVFAEPRGDRPVHWLVRACQDRALSDADAAGHVRAQALAAPVRYTVELQVRGRQAKTAAEDRARRRDRPPRRATVEVRAAALSASAKGFGHGDCSW